MLETHTDFAYWSRRARQEEVAAINARSRAASRAHRRLSALQAARAVLALLYPIGSAEAAAGASRAELVLAEATPC